jgi:hypothetical protein
VPPQKSEAATAHALPYQTGTRPNRSPTARRPRGRLPLHDLSLLRCCCAVARDKVRYVDALKGAV